MEANHAPFAHCPVGVWKKTSDDQFELPRRTQTQFHRPASSLDLRPHWLQSRPMIEAVQNGLDFEVPNDGAIVA